MSSSDLSVRKSITCAPPEKKSILVTMAVKSPDERISMSVVVRKPTKSPLVALTCAPYIKHLQKKPYHH